MVVESWTRIVLLNLLLYLAVADIQVTVHRTLDNGTSLRLPAQEFAKMAVEARGEGQISKRNAVKDWSHLWPRGVVYYDIDARTADFRLLQMLAPAFEFFKKYTCIRWKRRLPTNTAVQDYVIFSMPNVGTRLCNSEVGRKTGKQYIYLDTECVKSLAEILHQMTHALGFYHVNNRLDRDKYISVFAQNAATRNRKFFDKTPGNLADPMGFPYEHKSLMHFDGFKYATGSKPTIVSRVPGVMLGNKQALTVQDVTMINALYAQCKRSCRFLNGECEQTCHDTNPEQVYCSCIKGFRLTSDEKSCYDVDECSEQNGGCDQVCTRHGSWFECSCKERYSLAGDGYSGKPNDKCEDGSLQCEQECLYNKCSCKPGFILNKDGKSCDDVNECAAFNGGCESKCQNTHGSFHCSCPRGSFLSNDGISCTNVLCPNLLPVADGQVTCTNKEMVHGTVCQYACAKGFKLVGATETTCANKKWGQMPPFCEATSRCALDNGGCEQRCWANSWDNVQCSCRNGFKLKSDAKSCQDIEPPTITSCPQDIYSKTVSAKSWASVTWNLPEFYDNVGATIVSGPVMQDRIGGVFDIGSHSIEYVITDQANNTDTCRFKIKVDDVEPPSMFNCPSQRTYNVTSLEAFIEADWEDPGFWDNSEVEVKVTTDLPASRKIDPRNQEIHYIASDPSGNSVVCTVKVTVNVNTVNCDKFPFQPLGGHMRCDKFVFGTQCRPVCENGYDLTRDGIADIYSCTNNQWAPQLPPKNFACPATQRPLKAPVLYYTLRYRVSCNNRVIQSVQPIATAIANKHKNIFCPRRGDACKVTTTGKCSDEYLLVRVDTSEPVTPPITERYFSKIKDNIADKANGVFFYLPIIGSIIAPVDDPYDGKALPAVDFECQDNSIKDLRNLKCFTR